MASSASPFSSDYFSSRTRFHAAVTAAGGALETLALAAKGPQGQPLGIDVAWFGSAQPRLALVHTSGLHGVEGFAGSAIQLQLLERLPPLPAHSALLVVHVLNPYGMAWLRRVNEHNVDLNRNFLGVEPYTGVPDAYRKLDGFLNPATPPRPDLFTLRAAWLIARYGLPALKVAVVGGQYEYSKGLFFGGKEQQEGARSYEEFIAGRLDRVERLLAIDVHTGIGKYGEDLLMSQRESYEPLRALYGERVVSPDPLKSASYPVRGALDTMYARALPKAKVFPVTQEFGTYSPIKVLHALREENRWHHFGAGTIEHPVKASVKRTFCPDDERWREAVLRRGAALLQQALSVPL